MFTTNIATASSVSLIVGAGNSGQIAPAVAVAVAPAAFFAVIEGGAALPRLC